MKEQMKAEERDYRLKLVREEIAELKKSINEMEDDWQKQEAEFDKELEEDAKMKVEAEAASIKWKILEWVDPTGILYQKRRSKKSFTRNVVEGLVFFEQTEAQAKLLKNTQEKIKELQEKEAQLLGVDIEKEPKRAKTIDEKLSELEIKQNKYENLLDNESEGILKGRKREELSDREEDKLQQIENSYNEILYEIRTKLSKIRSKSL